MSCAKVGIVIFTFRRVFQSHVGIFVAGLQGAGG